MAAPIKICVLSHTLHLFDSITVAPLRSCFFLLNVGFNDRFNDRSNIYNFYINLVH